MHLRKATNKHDTKVKGMISTANLVRNLWLGNPSLYVSVSAFAHLGKFIVRQAQIVDDPAGFQEPQEGGIEQQANHVGF